VRCGFFSVSREQLFGPPAILLWTWVFSVLLYWALVSLPLSLSLGQGRRSVNQLSASVCYAGLLIVFQFWNINWLWLLLTGSADELCVPLCALFQAVAYQLPTVRPSAFPVFVYWNFTQRSASCTSPLLWWLKVTYPLCCTFLFSSLFIIHFFCRAGRSVCPGGYAHLFHGCLWENMCCLFAHLFVCWMSPKQVWSQHLAAQKASSFLSVMWSGEALYRLGVQAVKILILPFAFFLPSVAPVSHQKFWFTELTMSASVL
jgi:hypothetical protein